MQESIVFLVRVQCRRKESSRSLSHLLMSFLYALAVVGSFFFPVQFSIVCKYYIRSFVPLPPAPRPCCWTLVHGRCRRLRFVMIHNNVTVIAGAFINPTNVVAPATEITI